MQKLFKTIETPLPFFSATRTVKKFTIVAPLCAAVWVGTAGGYSATGLSAAVDSLSKTVFVSPTTAQAALVSEESGFIVKCLNEIRSGLCLNMSELALIFGISRPTLYGWFRGTRPKKETLKAIWRLHSAATQITSTNLRGVKDQIRRPIVAGQSLFDHLMSGRDIEAATQEFLRKIGAPATTVAFPRPLDGRVRRRVYTAEDISIPLDRESI